MAQVWHRRWLQPVADSAKAEDLGAKIRGSDPPPTTQPHAAQACPGGPWWPQWHLVDPDYAETTRRLRGDYAETDPDESLKLWAQA